MQARRRHRRDRCPRARRAVALLALAAAATVACAGPQQRADGRLPADRIAASHPEPDPGCRGTVRAPLLANGLEQVTVKVTVSREGRLSLLEFLAPDLTPTAAAELRAAYGACAWRPGLSPAGQPVESTAVLTFDRR